MIAIVGKGFISSHLQKLPHTLYDKRILSYEDIPDIKEDTIINCIGFTGSPNIDACEASEEAKQKTYHSNVIVPQLLKEYCVKNNKKLIHISSGCIYYGYKDGGWKEEDETQPLSFYSQTKKQAEDLLKDDALIIRIRMPISTKNDPRNLITKLKKYTKIIDTKNSVTFVDDLVRFIPFACDNNLTGIYNFVSETPLSAAEIMEEYSKIKDFKFTKITIEELNQITVAVRSNCLLNIDKLKATGFIMSDSKQKIIEILQNEQ